jgi:hypothetical protein
VRLARDPGDERARVGRGSGTRAARAAAALPCAAGRQRRRRARARTVRPVRSKAIAISSYISFATSTAAPCEADPPASLSEGSEMPASVEDATSLPGLRSCVVMRRFRLVEVLGAVGRTGSTSPSAAPAPVSGAPVSGALPPVSGAFLPPL